MMTMMTWHERRVHPLNLRSFSFVLAEGPEQSKKTANVRFCLLTNSKSDRPAEGVGMGGGKGRWPPARIISPSSTMEISLERWRR